MTRGLASPLPELLEIADGKVVAGEVQEAVDQHRTMSSREDESISIHPMRILRVVA
jgi:hypothetical protein